MAVEITHISNFPSFTLQNGRLTVLEQSSFNLGSGKAVTRNVDNVVNTSTDPVVSVMVTAGTITSELW
jgi:hypothetical protein